METPIRGLRFIHTAIEREATELEALAKKGPLPPSRVDFFKRVLHLHALGEELAIFPDVEARAKDVVPPYLLDHRAEEALLAELAGAEPARAAALLSEHLRLHIRKENEILTPLIERLFSPAEQGAQVQKMMSQFTPADMGEVLPWMIFWLDPDDRRAYVAMIERAMPPDRFNGTLAMLKQKLAAEVWATLGR